MVYSSSGSVGSSAPIIAMPSTYPHGVCGPPRDALFAPFTCIIPVKRASKNRSPESLRMIKFTHMLQNSQPETLCAWLCCHWHYTRTIFEYYVCVRECAMSNNANLYASGPLKTACVCERCVSMKWCVYILGIHTIAGTGRGGVGWRRRRFILDKLERTSFTDQLCECTRQTCVCAVQ